MEQNNKEKRANRILYITIAAMLCVLTLTVGVMTALNRGKTNIKQPTETTEAVSEKVPATAGRITHVTPPATSAESTTAATTATSAPAESAAAEPEIPTMILPVYGNIQKDYYGDILVYSNTMNDYRAHSGIDISASLGDRVYAAADGEVQSVYTDPLMGYTVEISHGGGYVSVYKNLAPAPDESALTVGAAVKAGDIVGAVGESAMIEIGDEPHLHFEVKLDGKCMNPLDYFADTASDAIADSNYED